MKEKVKYEIYSNNELVAQFVYKEDRDLCLNYLRETHEDCSFLTERK